MFEIFNFLKELFCFTGSYSNDSFLEPLSLEDEEKYINLKMNGNVDARNKLIEHNLRLVVFLAKKYENTGYDIEDLGCYTHESCDYPVVAKAVAENKLTVITKANKPAKNLFFIFPSEKVTLLKNRKN